MKKSNNKITGNLILGQNIRAIRISQKLTQEQFAEELEINPQFVSQIENGKVGISINKVIKICNLYNRSCIDVFKGLIEKPNILEEYELLEEKDKRIINQLISFMLNEQNNNYNKLKR